MDREQIRALGELGMSIKDIQVYCAASKYTKAEAKRKLEQAKKDFGALRCIAHHQYNSHGVVVAWVWDLYR